VAELTAQAAAAVRTAHALCRRDAALVELAALLNPSGSLSTWGTAGALADALRRFRCTAWPRIAAGHRAPRGAAEAALVALCEADTPGSARRLFDLLAELGL
jgi:hypothetical protein